jgi:hypothetical protein
MKAIVRSSIIALMVFAGYAALATPATTSKSGPFPMPKPSTQPCLQANAN